MRLIFAGTPVFAERALSALLDAGHQVVLVLTRQDQPAGRGKQLQASPVKVRALAAGVPVFQPRTLRDPDAQRVVAEAGADLLVVAAYGLILPQAVLDLPRLGCLNIHASLLPRWRGAAPIQRAIEAGDTETGITIMQMDAGLDTGPMLLAEALPIGPDDTGGSVHDRLAELGAKLVVQAIDGLAAGRLQPVVQPADGVTYARKLEKAEGAIDWTQPARSLADRIRAFDPFPGCTATLARAPESPLKIWHARVADAGPSAGRQGPDGPPTDAGTVLAAGPAGIDVQAGDGVLRLTALQRAGGRRLDAAAFLAGFSLAPGDRFV